MRPNSFYRSARALVHRHRLHDDPVFVRPLQRYASALDWTVPAGSWHTLNNVDLQLRDRLGTVALIRFHEADNTVSLFDPVSGSFGPAKAIGSPGFLETIDFALDVGALPVVSQAFEGPYAVGRIPCRRPRLAADLRDKLGLSFT